MEILRDDQVPAGIDAYYERAWGGLAACLLLSGATLGLIALPLVTGSGDNPWAVGAFLTGALLCGLLARMAWRMFRASLAPENRLLRWSAEGLYLRFRSVYNSRFAAGTPAVLGLRPREIAWVRGFAERLAMPDDEGAWTWERKRKGIELALRDGVVRDAVRAALAAEAQRRDAKGGRYNHYPVALTPEGTLKIPLRRPQEVLPALARLMPLAGAAERLLKAFETMSRTEQEDHILALAQAGDTLAAIKAARAVYGCGRAEAKRLVEGLTGGAAPPR